MERGTKNYPENSYMSLSCKMKNDNKLYYAPDIFASFIYIRQ